MSEIFTGDKLKLHPSNLILASSPPSQQLAGGDGAFLAGRHQCNKENILSGLYNQSFWEFSTGNLIFQGVQVSQVPQGGSNVTECPRPVWAAESHTRGTDNPHPRWVFIPQKPNQTVNEVTHQATGRSLIYGEVNHWLGIFARDP